MSRHSCLRILGGNSRQQICESTSKHSRQFTKMRKIYRYLDIFGANGLQKSFMHCGPFIIANIKLSENLTKNHQMGDRSFYLVGTGEW